MSNQKDYGHKRACNRFHGLGCEADSSTTKSSYRLGDLWGWNRFDMGSKTLTLPRWDTTVIGSKV